MSVQLEATVDREPKRLALARKLSDENDKRRILLQRFIDNERAFASKFV